MTEPTPFDERERADLVAYLDGELKGDAARKVENRIAADPVARKEAESLRRVWDMLDLLPVQEPSPEFTQRTVSQIAPVVRPTTTDRFRRPGRRYAIIAGWAAAVILAMAAGYGGSRMMTPREPGDAELIRDLRVIENKRLYDAAEDLDFVRELDAPDLFGDDTIGT